MNTKRKTKPAADRAIHARIPDRLYQDFEQIAVDNDRSVSAELRLAMRRHVEAHRLTEIPGSAEAAAA